MAASWSIMTGFQSDARGRFWADSALPLPLTAGASDLLGDWTVENLACSPPWPLWRFLLLLGSK